MTHVVTKPDRTKDPKAAPRPDDGMIGLAQHVEHHHIQPLPDAQAPAYEPFPPLLWHGLGWGTLAGLLLGLFFACLLLRGTLVIPNAEDLFSLVPVTFYTFWAMIGAALGLLSGGVGSILAAASPPRPTERRRD